MQALKNIAATVKEKAANTSADIQEKKDDTKIATEEKVEKVKAHGDETAKVEAMQRRDAREAQAERQKEHTQARNADEKERTLDPHPHPIGNRPSPADLDMSTENPTAPHMGGQASTFPSPTIPNFVGPTGSTVA